MTGAADLETRLVSNVVQGALALGVELEALDTTREIAWAAQETENLIRDISTEFGLLSSAEVGVRLGSTAGNRRSLANDSHRMGKLLALRRGNRKVYPGFQFAGGQIVPVIRQLRQVADECDWSEDSVVFWLCSASGSLDDRRPVDLLASDPDAVIESARGRFGAQW